MGVGGEQHLEAAIQREAVGIVASQTSPDAIISLEENHIGACICETQSAGQPRHPGTDDDHAGCALRIEWTIDLHDISPQFRPSSSLPEPPRKPAMRGSRHGPRTRFSAWCSTR